MPELTLDTRVYVIEEGDKRRDLDIAKIESTMSTEIEKLNNKLDNLKSQLLVLLGSTIVSLILLVINLLVGRFGK